jgi:hypothetical protein
MRIETLMRSDGHKGSMIVGVRVFPSMPKGEFVGKLVVNEFNPWRIMESL